MVNELRLCRYILSKPLNEKKYRLSVSGIDDTQKKVSVSVIMVLSHL